MHSTDHPYAACVDPGRSPMQLQLLPGICLATVAVSVAIQPTRSCVSRRPDCTQHSNSHRETRLHARACRPPSPVCTATAHTLSLSPHTVAHSHVPHSRRPHCSHTRGHSPAVSLAHTVPFSHTRGHSPAVSLPHRGVRTHVPPLARTWFLPPAVPLFHTACREARSPAHL